MRPSRYDSLSYDDPVYWQIIAAQDNTLVSFNSVGVVSGLPAVAQMLDAGERLGFLTDGVALAQPGSFTISATKPIGVAVYEAATELDRGPTMTMIPPLESLPTSAVFNVPASLELPQNQSVYRVVIAHPNNAVVTFDGGVLEPYKQHPISADWTSSIYTTAANLYVIESAEPFMPYFSGTDADGHYFLTLGAFDGK
jgi:hypothetical protein